MLMMGILPSFLMLLFCDTILDFAGVGYSNKGIQITGYELTSVRSFIAYVIIGGSSFSLRLIVDRADTLNQKLISELELKNQIIKQQAVSEVSQLNHQLIANLDELTKREFTLRKSQEIAKVGSWEFHQEADSMFWSDQMYHIFEVDKSFNVNSERASGLLFGESLNNIRKGLSDLLNQKAIDLTFQTTTPGGRIKWVRILGYPTINNNNVTGASGIVHDITYFKEAEDRITASERNYQSLFEQASDAIMIADISGNLVDVNTSACKMLGYEKEELLQLNISKLISPEQLASTPIKFKELIAGEQVIIERAFLRKNKTKLLVETNAKRIDENRIMAIVRDISERQQTARKLLKYNRELALLNSITVTSAHASDVLGLLNRICEILVDEGGYKLAWIGEVPSVFESQTIQPQISKGDAVDYAQDLVIDLQNANHQNGPICQALLTNKAIVTNQILNDPRHEEWSFNATRYGLHSSVGICINAEPIRYILNVYSGSPDSFDFNEVSILERIVTSVESAIKSINAFNERDLAKRELQRAYERLSYHITNTPLAVIERDKDLKVTFWNKRAEELFGWKADEMMGKKPHEFLAHPDDYKEMINLLEDIRGDQLSTRSKERRNIAKDGKELNCIWYYSLLRDDKGNLETFLSFVSDITEQKAANNQINKRVNELTTLYRVSQLLSKEYETMEGVLEKIVMILPRGWQHPEICEARIQVFDKQYKTRNYKDSAIMLEMPLTIHNELAGTITVVYLEDKSIDVESPFVIEERNLINVIAEMLQIYLERKQEKDALVKAQANLRATINNTEIMIWSLDRDFRLLTFNEPFERYNKEYFNLEIKPGASHRTFINDSTAKKWEDRYWRVLVGEIFEFEEKSNEIDFKFALSPIIENNQITGISIFADNVTSEMRGNANWWRPTKKLKDLKLWHCELP